MLLVFLLILCYFFFNYTASTEIYTYCHTLSLHDALPISERIWPGKDALQSLEAVERQRHLHPHDGRPGHTSGSRTQDDHDRRDLSQSAPHGVEPEGKKRSEEHTSELQSLMRTSSAVFCLQKKTHKSITPKQNTNKT